MIDVSTAENGYTFVTQYESLKDIFPKQKALSGIIKNTLLWYKSVHSRPIFHGNKIQPGPNSEYLFLLYLIHLSHNHKKPHKHSLFDTKFEIKRKKTLFQMKDFSVLVDPVLLNLSASFDTIDQHIPLQRSENFFGFFKFQILYF